MQDIDPPPTQCIASEELQDLDHARARVRALAQEIIRYTRRLYPRWSPPPFDPRFYARAMGIPIEFLELLPDLDALLVPAAEGFLVICDVTVRTEGRRRFSIAHELAHTFFADAREIQYRHTNAGPQYHRGKLYARIERLCNEGAAELLMPADDFTRAAARVGSHARAVRMLAREFRVSLAAAAVRMVQTSSEPCAVGFLHRGPRPGAARSPDAPGDACPLFHRYRVRKLYASAGFPYLLPPGKSIPRGSIIYHAALGRDQGEKLESYTLGERTQVLRVTASALGSTWYRQAAPTICAVFRLP